MKFSLTTAAVITAFFSVISASSAAPVLDQQNIGSVGAAVLTSDDSVSGLVLQAQTFTASLTGQLTSLNLALFQFSGQGNVNVSINSVSGGLPTTTSLGQVSIDSSSLSTDPFMTTLTNFDFSALDVYVTAGQTLAIVASATTPDTAIGWSASSIDVYSGGENMAYSPSFGWIYYQGDNIFQTFVDTARQPGEVPEPATVALMGISFLGLAALRRKRLH